MEASKFVKVAVSKDKTKYNLMSPWVRDGVIIGCDGHRIHLEATKLPDYSDIDVDRPEVSGIWSGVSFEYVAEIKLNRDETQDLLGVLKLLKNRTVTIKNINSIVYFICEGLSLNLSFRTDTRLANSPSVTIGLDSKYLFDALSNFELIHKELRFNISVSSKDPQYRPVKLVSCERTAYIMPTKI